jgi:hypothetical protein
MLGLGLNLNILGSLTLSSIVSYGNGAKNIANELFNRVASDSGITESYDCLVSNVSGLGVDTVYDFSAVVYTEYYNRIVADSAISEGQECFELQVANLSR